jgi:hypothetical protein
MPDFYRTPSPAEMVRGFTTRRDTIPNPIGSIKQALDAPQRHVFFKTIVPQNSALCALIQKYF